MKNKKKTANFSLTFLSFIFGSLLGPWAILLLDPGSPDSIRGWPPSHGMNLKLDQLLVGLSNNFYAMLTPEHHVGRTNRSPKVLCLGWCSNTYTVSIIWLEEMVGSGSIYSIVSILERVSLIAAREFPLLGF